MPGGGRVLIRLWLLAGIATYIWLNMILAKANETLRKQVALKQDCSKRQCVSLAALMGMHVAFILLLFRRQELWLQFALLGTASVPTVCLWSLPCRSAGCSVHAASTDV